MPLLELWDLAGKWFSWVKSIIALLILLEPDVLSIYISNYVYGGQTQTSCVLGEEYLYLNCIFLNERFRQLCLLKYFGRQTFILEYFNTLFGSDPSHACWELNWGPEEEEQTLLTIEPSLQASSEVWKCVGVKVFIDSKLLFNKTIDWTFLRPCFKNTLSMLQIWFQTPLLLSKCYFTLKGQMKGTSPFLNYWIFQVAPGDWLVTAAYHHTEGQGQGQCDCLANKGACHQAWRPKFNSQDPQNEGENHFL